QRVPFRLKVPDVDGKGTVEEHPAQVDVVPTMLHVLGIRADDYIQFGTELLSEDHDETVALRNGDYFTPEVRMISDTCYDDETGEEIEPTEELEAIQQKVQHELEVSDRVLQGDLLRFNVPNEDWSPVDMNDYFYDVNQVDVDESLYEKWLGRPTLRTDEDI